MATNITSVGTSGFPQKSKNLTRSKVLSRIASYIGGASDAMATKRAGEAWEDAIESYNEIFWSFNRVRQDITLVADTNVYTLNTDWRAYNRAVLLDSNSVERITVEWIDWDRWTDEETQQTHSSGIPYFYTAENTHERGEVRVDPTPGSSITYPTLRLYYWRWIEVPTAGGSQLNVPRDIDRAIYKLGVAMAVHKATTAREAAADYALAEQARQKAEDRYRQWPDY
jgi:hypothetical protein